MRINNLEGYKQTYTDLEYPYLMKVGNFVKTVGRAKGKIVGFKPRLLGDLIAIELLTGTLIAAKESQIDHISNKIEDIL